VRLEDIFPRLSDGHYEVTSPDTPNYNCIAWAAGSTERWWWPPKHPFQVGYYWPPEAPAEETVEAFIEAYRTIGFELCDSLEPVDGVEKIAIFTDAQDKPTHAARQLENGLWTSKCGRMQDIEHELTLLEGEVYGTVDTIMCREASTEA
jgi:hypothetical protein